MPRDLTTDGRAKIRKTLEPLPVATWSDTTNSLSLFSRKTYATTPGGLLVSDYRLNQMNKGK